MKRGLLMVLLLLVGGAIVNIAVALLAVLLYPHPWFYCAGGRTEVPNTATDLALWSRHATDSWPASPPPWHSECLHIGAKSRRIAVGVSWMGSVSMDETPEERRERERGTGTFDIVRLEYGFPACCCALERWQESDSIAVAGIGSEQHDGLAIAERKLPKQVSWPGFAINTAFYAVALWLLFAAPLALRRRRRIKRGLCPKCAYDLRGTQTGVCPECGATR